jgi:hypothetical protein
MLKVTETVFSDSERPAVAVSVPAEGPPAAVLNVPPLQLSSKADVSTLE